MKRPCSVRRLAVIAKAASALRAAVRLALLLGMIAGSACLRGAGPSEITVEGATAVGSPVFVGVGSVFMKIKNTGRGDDLLLAAGVELPGALVELHDTKDGKMVKQERIEIPAGGAVELRPGGLHLMVFRMPTSLKAGDVFTVILSFEKAGNVPVPVRVAAGRR